MADQRSQIRISKLLSLMLRHRPQEFGIDVDQYGFADLEEVLAALQKKDRNLAMSDIESVVYDGEKERFEIDEGSIRARYGHSFQIDLGIDPTEPPEFLYKGVSPDEIGEVLKSGLIPYDRKYVHLSFMADVAEQLARFEGVPGAVIRINAQLAHDNGTEFFDCGPTVLTREVSSDFLEEHVMSEREDESVAAEPNTADRQSPADESSQSFGRRRKFSSRRR